MDRGRAGEGSYCALFRGKGGLTQDKIKGMYHHPATYWKGDNLEAEAIAHFFEARAAGGEKLEILKRYFPSAFAYFEKAL